MPEASVVGRHNRRSVLLHRLLFQKHALIADVACYHSILKCAQLIDFELLKDADEAKL